MMLLKYTGKAGRVGRFFIRGRAKADREAALREREWVYQPEPGLAQAINIAFDRRFSTRICWFWRHRGLPRLSPSRRWRR